MRHGSSSGWPLRCACFTSPWRIPTASRPSMITSFWPGDGTDRTRAGYRLRFLRPLPGAHRPDRLGGAALSPASGRSLQAFRCLHPAIGMGDLHHQQPLFGPDGADHLGDRGALLQPERGPVVGLDLGALSGSHAICGSLGVGDVAFRLPVLLGAGGGAAHAPVRRRPHGCPSGDLRYDRRALGSPGASLGFGRAQQSGAADLFAGLRALGAGRSSGLAAPGGWGAAGGCAVQPPVSDPGPGGTGRPSTTSCPHGQISAPSYTWAMDRERTGC